MPGGQQAAPVRSCAKCADYPAGRARQAPPGPEKSYMSNNKMLIDASHPEETRVVVSRGNRIEEFDFKSANKKPLRGNIYLAKVTRVEPSLQAAFVDYGGNRHGFLAFSEIHPDYYQIPVADRIALLEEEAREQREEAAEEENRSNRRNRRNRGNGRRARRSNNDDETVSGDAPADHAEGDDVHDDVQSQGDSAADETVQDAIASISDVVAGETSPGEPGAHHVPDEHSIPASPIGETSPPETTEATPARDEYGIDAAPAPLATDHADEPYPADEADDAENPAGEPSDDDDDAADSDSEDEEESVEQLGGDSEEDMPRAARRSRRQYKI